MHLWSIAGTRNYFPSQSNRPQPNHLAPGRKAVRARRLWTHALLRHLWTVSSKKLWFDPSQRREEPDSGRQQLWAFFLSRLHWRFAALFVLVLSKVEIRTAYRA